MDIDKPGIDPERRRLDQICDQFEQRWSSDQRLSIEECLENAADRSALLRELIAVEIELRVGKDEQPRPEEYLARFPDAHDEVHQAFRRRAAIAETVVRENSGNTAVPESSATRAYVTGGGRSRPSELPGYTLLDELGRGGMGVVYKARQNALNRIVALKTIRAGELASEEEVRRFLAEAEAAAKLDHPNIVPIHEIGAHDGLHFFSMAYVAGPSLRDRLAEGVFAPHEAARLVRELSAAVQYAHDKGIVHRDLKPANVLLAAGGHESSADQDSAETEGRPASADASVPKITDFGLAKHIEADSTMTATGQILGTPSYMPPEQAAGETARIGPLSDVYSLGAILYALLTGRPPFQAANVMETLQQVIEREPVSPRQLNASVDRDLSTICLKCLSKDPESRYRSAGDLAEDLDRFLDGKPILARPVGRVARTWRWCRRNRMATAVIALVLVLAGGGPTVAVVLANALSRETSARELASRNQDRANEVVRKFLTEIGKEDGPLSRYPDTQRLRKQLLEMARDYYEELIADNASGKLTPQLAAAHYQLALLMSRLSGDREQAIRTFRQARQAYEQLARENPDEAKYKRHLANTCNSMSADLEATGRRNEALVMLETARRILEELIENDPQTGDLLLLAACHDNVGAIYGETKRLSEAIASHQTALDLHSRLAGENPRLSSRQRLLAVSHHRIGSIHRILGNKKQAFAAFRESLRILESLARAAPNDAETAFRLAATLTGIGLLHQDVDATAEAFKFLTRGRDIYERLWRLNPTVSEYQRGLARALRVIGQLQSSTGNVGEAMKSFRRSADISRRLGDLDPSVVHYQSVLSGDRNLIGELQSNIGESSKALATYENAVKTLERLISKNPDVTRNRYDLTGVLINIGEHSRRSGQTAEALAAFQRALKTARRLTEDNPEVLEYQRVHAASHFGLALVYERLEQPGKAFTAYRHALSLREQLAKSHPEIANGRYDVGITCQNIAALHQETGDLPSALKMYQRAQTTLKQLVDRHPKIVRFQSALANVQNNIGAFHELSKDSTSALKSFRLAIETQKRLVEKHPSVTDYRDALAASYNNIGVCFGSNGQRPEELAAYRQSCEILLKLVKENPSISEFKAALANSYENIGRSHRMTGNSVEAVKAYRRAVSIRHDLADKNPNSKESQIALSSCAFNLGTNLQQTGQLDEGLTFHQQALKLRIQLAKNQPNDSKHQLDVRNSHHNIGVLHSTARRNSEAIRSHRRAIEVMTPLIRRYPKEMTYQAFRAESHHRIGILCIRLSNWADALIHFREAAKIDPNGRRHFFVGGVLQQLKQLDESNTALRVSIQRDPGFVSAYQFLATNYEKQRKYENALHVYDRLLALRARDWKVHMSRGRMLQALKRSSEAMRAYNSAHRLSSDQVAVLESLARYLSNCPDTKLRDGRRAVQLAQRACELTKWKQGRLLVILAGAYAETGDFTQAVEWLTKAIPLLPPKSRASARALLVQYQSDNKSRDAMSASRPVVARKPRAAIMSATPPN